ncbi:transposase, partial [Paenibacillus xylanexedens]|uniref:transposase n=1 Tax=Paenibacillus xylanexedens TaxID=528191 RepID=UPI0011AA69C0
QFLHNLSAHLEIDSVPIHSHKHHTHILLNPLPTLTPPHIIPKIKPLTSKKLPQHFPHLLHFPTFSTRSYFLSTPPILSTQTIKPYLQQQNTTASNP